MSDDPFAEPAIARTADRVRVTLRSDEIRPEFSRRLRAELVAAAAAQIEARRSAGGIAGAAGSGATAGTGTGPLAAVGVQPERPVRAPGGHGHLGGAVVRPLVPRAAATLAGVPGVAGEAAPGRRRDRRRPRRRVATWVSAAAAAAAVAVGTVPTLLRPDSVGVKASSALTGALSADPGTPIRLTFDRDVDHASVQSALRIAPAALVRTSWKGNTMTVTPVHGLAPGSVYRVTVAARTARTAGGAPLAADLLLAFGTAPAADGGTPAGAAAAPAPAPAALRRVAAATAGAAAQAVVTRSGAMLLTDGRTAGATGLLRLPGPGAPAGAPAAAPQRVAAAADVICVSRSGRSVVFLTRSGATALVLADATGTPERSIPAAVDPGSPLGWIDDEEVTFVSGGRLRAMDRQGRQRVLSPTPVDLGQQRVVLAPGGRYAYLGETRTAEGRSAGRLVDLVSGASRRLTGLVTEPAFTADGAGVLWLDAAGGRVRLHHGAAVGGPETTAVLPVPVDAEIGGLAVAPDGARFVYSVTTGSGAQQRSELRLAALPSGVTLAASDAGVGESPKFAPTGRFLTVLARTAGGHRIETIDLPPDAATAEAVAAAFATAQVGADPGAQGWLSQAGLVVPAPPAGVQVTRADVVRSQPADDGTVTVTVRLTDDGRPGRPWPVQAEETLTVAGSASGSGSAGGSAGSLSKVVAVRSGGFAAAPAGPQLLHLEAGPASEGGGRQVTLTVDSDLDPSSVAAAVRVRRAGGVVVPADVRLDAPTRTVTVRLPGVTAGTALQVAVDGLRDVVGDAMPAAVLDVRA